MNCDTEWDSLFDMGEDPMTNRPGGVNNANIHGTDHRTHRETAGYYGSYRDIKDQEERDKMNR